MANVYMAEADFDDNDEWFHDGIDDKPIIQDMNIEVREEQRQLVKWYKFDGSLIQLMFNNFKLFPVFVFILLIFSRCLTPVVESSINN